jgi:hypothetical protein
MRTLSIVRTAAVCAIGLTAGLATVSRPAQALVLGDDTYTIQRVYKAGDVDHYNMTMSGTFSGIKALGPSDNVPVKMKAVLKETTKSVNADGSAVILSEMESALANISDQGEIDISTFIPAVTQTRDKLGKVLESKAEGGTSQLPPGADPGMLVGMLNSAMHSPKAVKVGDSWDLDLTLHAGARAMPPGKGTAKLVGMETVDGVNTAKVEATVDIGGDAAKPATGQATDTTNGEKRPAGLKVHVVSTGNVDLATGKVLKMTGTFDIEMKRGDASSTKAHMSITSTLGTGAAAAPAAAK